MLNKIFKKIVGTRNDRILKGYRKVVAKINALEPDIQKLSDVELQAKTDEFKQLLKEGRRLDSILPEAFAVVRQASQRTLGMRHFDVQLIGGMVLHDGRIAEMRTGEGKTLAGTLPAYLNALSGDGVHIITVNDYLAKRDAEWMRPIFEFLGLTVGINLTGMEPAEKQEAYAADIIFGTNNEFGFDYLRDNMVFSSDQQVQGKLSYAIVDEVDSILIDEARTPLIISGQAEESSDLYTKVNQVVPQLKLQEVEEKEGDIIPEDKRGDYTLDEKSRQAHLTDQGHEHIESLLMDAGVMRPGESLYDVANITLMHYVNACLRSHSLYQCDVHYIVKNDEVIIVDEHTGRLMPGRRWSDGLHQAVEAKEGATIQLENQTLATITFQNYFRLYGKLSGMTGTADTEAYELQKIYGLEVVVVPTNKPAMRKDAADQIFLTERGKYKEILKGIKTLYGKGQPILVGTASIESSELLSGLMHKEGIPHEVLNAKQHEREAKIIAQAGRPGAITIATNMAGRGTDIVLGGNLEVELAELGEEATEDQINECKANWKECHDKVLAAGGLHVLGTERHESRRIDNQLRGRSGRQGDGGSSQFYLSMDDNLLRIFGSERMTNLMRRLGVKEDDVIQHSLINRAIENAQRRVEGLNFDMRKNLLEYDDVANDQRKVVYQQRGELLKAKDITKTITEIRAEAISDMVTAYIPPQSLEEQWDVPGLEQQIHNDFGLSLKITDWLEQEEQVHESTISQRVLDAVVKAYEEKAVDVELESLHEVEKAMMLQTLDHHWKENLAAMDHLRQGIHLRGYAQKNPAQEYKRESFELFKSMLERVKYGVVSALSNLEFSHPDDMVQEQHALPDMQFQHADMNLFSAAAQQQTPEPQPEQAPFGAMRQQMPPPSDQVQPFVREQPKVGRNDTCPCGSGKKYKQCHGKI
jgi:preprotein translocase subunit SecA